MLSQLLKGRKAQAFKGYTIDVQQTPKGFNTNVKGNGSFSPVGTFFSREAALRAARQRITTLLASILFLTLAFAQVTAEMPTNAVWGGVDGLTPMSYPATISVTGWATGAEYKGKIEFLVNIIDSQNLTLQQIALLSDATAATAATYTPYKGATFLLNAQFPADSGLICRHDGYHYWTSQNQPIATMLRCNFNGVTIDIDWYNP